MNFVMLNLFQHLFRAMDKFRINLLGNKNTRFESMVFLISFFILAISMCFNAKSYIELNNKKMRINLN